MALGLSVFFAGSAAGVVDEEDDAGASGFAFGAVGARDCLVSSALHPLAANTPQTPTMTNDDFIFIVSETQL